MEFTTDTDFTLPYRYLSPKTVKPKKLYPLVVVLHGAGERGNDNEKQLTHGADLFLAAQNRKEFPAFVIFPQCREESYWSSVDVDRSSYPVALSFDYSQKDITQDLEAVMLLVKSMIKDLPIDKKRIYLTGLSMGGMGTFEMIHRYPKCFAAAMPICGGGDVINYTKKGRKVPFWIFHGAVDGVVNVQESKKMVAILKSKKYKVTYTEYPDVNHNSWDNAFAEPTFMSWMFAQRR